MGERNDPVLVIVDGGLAGLTAAWAAGVVSGGSANSPGGRAASVCWMPQDERPARAMREKAAQRQAQMCGMSGLILANAMAMDPALLVGDDRGEAVRVAAGASVSAMLLSACAQAMTLGIGRVIWPLHQGGVGAGGPIESAEIDLEWMSEMTDRALLAGQLASVDVARVRRDGRGGAGGGGSVGMVRVETPYADFSDAELLDLALDLDVPLGAAWWCEREGEGEGEGRGTPCGACGACEQWRAALGVVDPQSLLDAQRLFGGLART